MSHTPIPVRFEPIFKLKPWGGRTLAALFEKPLPGGESIGESWELVSLPGNESHVSDGPLAGVGLHELVERWGDDLLGGAPLIDGRFPLLIKFLDARENLSVQVHPRPPAEDAAAFAPGVKHEAWYVLGAEPDAKMYIGLNPSASLDELRRSGNSPRTAELLQAWPAQPGDCFYLPSGVIHALGGGLVVAEVQTPSDVTYRLYDWDRVDPDGKPRELHIDETLANVRPHVPREEIAQPRHKIERAWGTATRTVSCPRFTIDVVETEMVRDLPVEHDGLLVWILLEGRGALEQGELTQPMRAGDTLLIPAAAKGLRAMFAGESRFLEVSVPKAG